jgi:hypothetical protein
MNIQNPKYARTGLTGLFAIVAMLLGVLTLSLGTASSASATDASQYGYSQVTMKEAYLRKFASTGVMTVDTAHETSGGFWLALHSPDTARGFAWYFQSYGMWCSSSGQKVALNPWMNTYWCMTNPDAPEIQSSASATNTANCQASTGYPWKKGTIYASNTGCLDNNLSWARNTLVQPELTMPSGGCAPWEVADCTAVTYPWSSGPANTYWMPSPDACTQMPADANKHVPSYDPQYYAPATGGDGSCDGSTPAPNCTTATVSSDACQATAPVVAPAPSDTTVREDSGTTTSSPDQTFSATATATASASVTSTRSATVSVEREVVRYRVTRSATYKYHGRKYRGYGTGYVVKSAVRGATRSSNATATATATETSSCTGASQDEAQACADRKAAELAQQHAQASAGSSASSKAYSIAHAAAESAASTTAYEAAKGAGVTYSEKKVAKRQAKYRARVAAYHAAH